MGARRGSALEGVGWWWRVIARRTKCYRKLDQIFLAFFRKSAKDAQVQLVSRHTHRAHTTSIAVGAKRSITQHQCKTMGSSFCKVCFIFMLSPLKLYWILISSLWDLRNTVLYLLYLLVFHPNTQYLTLIVQRSWSFVYIDRIFRPHYIYISMMMKLSLYCIWIPLSFPNPKLT